MTENDSRVPAERLAAFIARAFVAAGIPATDAETLSQLMVEADLRGSDTHGVIRLPLYVRRIRAGGVNPKPNIRVVSDRPSAALLDGDNGMGHLVMKRAAELAIDKARATGIGWVLARRLFSLQYALDPWVWVVGLVCGTILVGVSGTLATRRVVNTPPIHTLRDE